MNRPYVPIACDLHDELLLRALRGRPVRVVWRTADGTVRERTDAIRDVVSRGGAEVLILGDGGEVRLDRLVTVDGISFAPDRC